jgi:hypothetical protein
MNLKKRLQVIFKRLYYLKKKVNKNKIDLINKNL